MLKLNISGIPQHLKEGLSSYINVYGGKYDLCLDIDVHFSDEKTVSVARHGGKVSMTVSESVQLFRGITSLLIHSENTDFELKENSFFDMNGAMFDFSQASAFMTVQSVKSVLLTLACAGLNTFMLYSEDTLEVKGEPYFGYMRPKYSAAELREIDDFAYSLGIEVIPCVQTLSHLPELMRWNCYKAFSDDERTLLVGDGRTYELIEKVLLSVTEPLRSNKVHIGLDEAWGLGQGNYLRRNGYTPKSEIFASHVKRVKEITDRLGLYAMLWNDMYFRAATENNEYYLPIEAEISPEKVNAPSGMGYVYWDYYHKYDYYKANLKKHLKLFSDVIFAGCSRNTYSLGSMYTSSVQITDDALTACKEEGVRRVFCTVWGDNSRESPPFAMLPGIIRYAEHGYAFAPAEESITKRFSFAVGAEISDFAAISEIDIIDGYNSESKNAECLSPSRHLMYEDVLLGLFDKNYEKYDLETHFSRFADKMAKISSKGEGFSEMFSFYASLGRFLELKSTLGKRLCNSYRNRDKAELKRLAENTIPEAISRLEAFRNLFRSFFFRYMKPCGYEVFDIRTGGIIARLETARYRVEDFLKNGTEINELCEERLLFDGRERVGSVIYSNIATATRI